MYIWTPTEVYPSACTTDSYTLTLSDELGIEEGMIMSTGNAISAIGPNEQSAVTTQFYTPGDPDLNNLTEYLTFDACIIEFDFLAPSDNLLACEFVFASEEYPEFIGSMFNDIFGFFISEPYEDIFGDLDPNFSQELQNIAYIPGTDLPISINNVNNYKISLKISFCYE